MGCATSSQNREPPAPSLPGVPAGPLKEAEWSLVETQPCSLPRGGTGGAKAGLKQGSSWA